MIDVLERISHYRKLKGWSEYQLSEKASIPQSTINSWNHKNFVPTISSLDKICNAFGITLSEFFSEDNSQALTPQQQALLDAVGHLEEDQLNKLITFIESL